MKIRRPPFAALEAAQVSAPILPRALHWVGFRLERRRRRVAGHCIACGTSAGFLASREGGNQRESMVCRRCGSQSRKRHVVQVILRMFAPEAKSLAQADLRRLSVYSAVGGDVLQRFLAPRTGDYVCSELLDGVPLGAVRDGVACQDLERLTFGDARFDLVITEDVLEHVRQPEQALAEIHRVLKPGGAHVFTVPWHADRRTVRRLGQGDRHPLPAEYHYDAAGRPVLVCTQWGYDLFDTLAAAGFTTDIALSSYRDAMDFGIADSIVFVSRKPA